MVITSVGIATAPDVLCPQAIEASKAEVGLSAQQLPLCSCYVLGIGVRTSYELLPQIWKLRTIANLF